jgi:hypothetical protein
MKSSLLLAKRVDVYGQLAMIVLPLVIAMWEPNALGYMLFTLGGWQLCSIIVHFRLGEPKWMQKSRPTCGLLMLILLMMVLTAFMGESFGLLILTLIAGPVAGIWYIIVSVNELRAIEDQRQNTFFEP